MKAEVNIEVKSVFNEVTFCVEKHAEVYVLGNRVAFWGKQQECKYHCNQKLTEADQLARDAYVIACENDDDRVVVAALIKWNGDYRTSMELIDTQDTDGKIHGRIVTKSMSGNARDDMRFEFNDADIEALRAFFGAGTNYKIAELKEEVANLRSHLSAMLAHDGQR